MTIIVDTADYQRGVVSAQILLDAIAPGANFPFLGIPPNAETLIIAGTAPNDLAVPEVIGQVSGISYAGLRAQSQFGADASPVYFFDISSVVDNVVEVVFSVPTVSRWFAYTDSAARVVVNVSQAGNEQGVGYVIPTIPNTATGDHPPNELLAFSGQPSANTTVIAAPGVGKRLRVFSAIMGTSTAGLSGVLVDSASVSSRFGCVGPATVPLTLPGQGSPLPTNTALNYLILGGAGTMLVIVYYTIETV